MNDSPHSAGKRLRLNPNERLIRSGFVDAGQLLRFTRPVASIASAIVADAAVAAAKLTGGHLLDDLNQRIENSSPTSLTKREVEAHASKAATSMAARALDNAWLTAAEAPAILRSLCTHGLGNLDEALESGRGAVALFPHIGNWNFVPSALKALNYDVAYVLWKGPNRGLHDVARKTAARTGYQLVFHDPQVPESGASTLKTLREALDRGAAVVMSGDVFIPSGKRGGVSVEMGGAWREVGAGPALIGLDGVPLLPTAALLSGTKHELFIQPPLDIRQWQSIPRIDAVQGVSQVIGESMDKLSQIDPGQTASLFGPLFPSSPVRHSPEL